MVRNLHLLSPSNPAGLHFQIPSVGLRSLLMSAICSLAPGVSFWLRLQWKEICMVSLQPSPRHWFHVKAHSQFFVTLLKNSFLIFCPMSTLPKSWSLLSQIPSVESKKASIVLSLPSRPYVLCPFFHSGQHCCLLYGVLETCLTKSRSGFRLFQPFQGTVLLVQSS